MKDLDLTGIGNALVDLQYEISEEDFYELNFDKGTMSLVDIDKQKLLMSKFEGEFKKKMSGGSAANTIIAFSRFGGKSAYISMLGDDELASHYESEFNDLDIVLKAEKVKNNITGTCFVIITPDAERTLVTSLGANTSFSKDHIDEDLIKRSKWFYIEGYKFTEESGTESINYAIELCKKHNTKIALTFSDTFIIEIFKEQLSYAIDNADLIFCNDSEAKAYTRRKTSEEALNDMKKMNLNFAYTMSEKGSKVYWEGKQYDIDAYPTKAVDATGAGDAFAGGFLYGIIKNNDPVFAAKLGSLLASEIVSSYGPRYEGDQNELLKKF